MHFEQQHGACGAQDWRDRVIDGQGLAGGRGQQRFAFGKRVRLLNRQTQRLQGLGGLGEQFADELPMAALPADGQQHFRRRVHVLKTQSVIEQQRGGGQVVE